MAGDWIKLSTDLWDAPEIIEIVELTGLMDDAVVGKVARIWSWFDRHTENGTARITLAYLNHLVSCPQFAEAMCAVGWLLVNGRHVQLPRFDRHNGQTAKARALTARRVKRSRNAAERTTALPEKSREEKKDPNRSLLLLVPQNPQPTPQPAPTQPAKATPLPRLTPQPKPTQQQIETIYAAYPRKVGSAKAKAEIARALRKVTFDRLLAAVQEFALSRVGEDPQWTPYPERWFSKERWNDDPREWKRGTGISDATRLGPGQIYDPEAQSKDPTVGRL
jgi:hypothetical protein